MADTRSLRFIGILYGALTGMTALIAVAVVTSHLQGKLSLDDSRASFEMSASRR